MEAMRQGKLKLDPFRSKKFDQLQEDLAKLENEFDMESQAGGGDFRRFDERRTTIMRAMDRELSNVWEPPTAEEQLGSMFGSAYSPEEFEGVGVSGGRPVEATTKSMREAEMKYKQQEQGALQQQKLAEAARDIYKEVYKQNFNAEEAKKAVENFLEQFGGGGGSAGGAGGNGGASTSTGRPYVHEGALGKLFGDDWTKTPGAPPSSQAAVAGMRKAQQESMFRPWATM
jgi:hypothetical protein